MTGLCVPLPLVDTPLMSDAVQALNETGSCDLFHVGKTSGVHINSLERVHSVHVYSFPAGVNHVLFLST